MKKLFLVCFIFNIATLSGCIESEFSFGDEDLTEDSLEEEFIDRSGLFDYTSMDVPLISFSLYDGFSSEELNTLLVNDGYLTVGTSADYAPGTFLDTELTGLRNVQGSESALSYFVAKSLGLELEYKLNTFTNLFTDLKNSESDVIFSSLTYTDERAEYYTLTDSYYNISQVLVCNKSDLDKYNTIDDINTTSVSIAAINNSYQYDLVSNQLHYTKVSSTQTISESVLQLKNNSVDFISLSYESAQSVIFENDDLIIVDFFEFDCEDSNTVGVVDSGNRLVDYINLALSFIDNDTYKTWVNEYVKYAETINA